MLDSIKKFIGKKFTNKTFRTVRTGDLFTLRNTDFGKINVESDMIRRVVERAVTDIEGVHEISAEVEKPTEGNSLKVRFSLALEQDYSAQNIGAELAKRVREVLQDMFQIADVEIYMRVKDIAQAQKKSVRRVR